MKYTCITSAFALASTVLAQVPPSYQNNNKPPGNSLASPLGAEPESNGPMGLKSNCLSQDEARQFVKRFSGVLDHTGSDLGDAGVTARALVSEDFVEYSNSILSLQGLPVNY